MTTDMERILMSLGFVLILEAVTAVRTFILLFCLVGTKCKGKKIMLEIILFGMAHDRFLY